MKKILLLTLVVLSRPGAKAQKIELGLNGGVTPYISMNNTFTKYGNIIKYPPGYYASLKLGLILGGWQLGAGGDIFQTGEKMASSKTTDKARTKYSTLDPYLYLNKIFRLPKSFVYAGLNGGITTGSWEAEITSAGFPNSFSNKDYSGYSGGVQAGFTLNLVKGLGANIEAGARYIHLQEEVTRGKGNVANQMIFPVSLGVRYTF